MLITHVTEHAPKTPTEKKLLLSNLRQRKKEPQTEKREVTTAMKAIREEARKQSAIAGKRGFLEATGSFGDGKFSHALGWYDSELAAAQRRKIRSAKERAIAPHEATRLELEQEQIMIETHH